MNRYMYFAHHHQQHPPPTTPATPPPKAYRQFNFKCCCRCCWMIGLGFTLAAVAVSLCMKLLLLLLSTDRFSWSLIPTWQLSIIINPLEKLFVAGAFLSAGTRATLPHRETSGEKLLLIGRTFFRIICHIIRMLLGG